MELIHLDTHLLHKYQIVTKQQSVFRTQTPEKGETCEQLIRERLKAISKVLTKVHRCVGEERVNSGGFSRQLI